MRYLSQRGIIYLPAALRPGGNEVFMKRYLKYVILAAAAGALVLGIVSGEAEMVLEKATAICLECIGIG